ncbi:TVP38/TMEM64 family protein [Natranaerofaba carboxydovora]|uniref:TVP38/TMEM64 family protein n=1 Tax=Natranaerofaba carboxydovora TaxID=2742683 RepID=UPI001F1431C7|nr:VTT domain-containing protein [Natranaerofaba carboxydovora]UMZ73787.1 TVP38/TMEM64 family inner membrane protein YdjZ [Natranaerofaba carboxydovora]
MKVKKVIVLSFVVLIFSVSYYLFFSGFFSVDKLQNLLVAGGWIAPLIYLVLHAFRPFSFLPSSLLVLAGGLVFDFWWGVFLCILGFMVGSSLVYILGKRWGDLGTLNKKYTEKAKQLTRVLKGKSKYFLASICLIPLLPSDLVSYASGASEMNFFDFFGGKLLGSLPGLILVFLSGSQIKTGDWTYLIISVVGLVCLTVLVWFKKKDLASALEI